MKVITLWILMMAPAWADTTLGLKLHQQLKKSGVPLDEVAMEVRSLQAGDLLFEHRGSTPMNPASSLKVIIAATSLSKLGTNFRFKTNLVLSGKDLCLIGGGDPSLVYEDLLPLVTQLLRAGVRKIQGDLIVDESRFPVVRPALEDFEGDIDRAFTAPIAPLSINFNSLTVDVWPTKDGQAPSIGLEPDLPIFKVVNRAKTVATGGPKDIGASVKETKEGFTVEVFGKIGRNFEHKILYRSVANPGLYAAETFLDRFQKEGGEFSGKTRFTKCPSTNQPIVSFESKPLHEIVEGLNKFSNNFIADMLLRAIGNEPTTDSGLKAISDWLKAEKIEAPELRMENASGLSEKTKISSHTLVEVVRKGAKHFSYGAEYLSSFGIAGVDGTLKRRFKGSKGEEQIRAKSGMLRGVVSLTGAADRERGEPIVFSIIFNTTKKDPSFLMKLEESLLLTIITEPKN